MSDSISDLLSQIRHRKESFSGTIENKLQQHNMELEKARNSLRAVQEREHSAIQEAANVSSHSSVTHELDSLENQRAEYSSEVESLRRQVREIGEEIRSIEASQHQTDPAGSLNLYRSICPLRFIKSDDDSTTAIVAFGKPHTTKIVNVNSETDHLELFTLLNELKYLQASHDFEEWTPPRLTQQREMLGCP